MCVVYVLYAVCLVQCAHGVRVVCAWCVCAACVRRMCCVFSICVWCVCLLCEMYVWLCVGVLFVGV